MKGYRFYLEYATPKDKRQGTVKNPGPHMGTVIAVNTEIGICFSQGEEFYEAAAGVTSLPNSDVCGAGASLDYLSENCRRIPERLAREIHPALFEYLEG